LADRHTPACCSHTQAAEAAWYRDCQRNTCLLLLLLLLLPAISCVLYNV
jgi:hypothetical protein